MQIFIDDKLVEELTKKQRKWITIGKEHAEAKTTIISEDAATLRATRTSNIFHVILGILVALLLGGMVIGVLWTDDNTLNKPLILGFALVIAIFIAFMFRYSTRKWRRNWNKAVDIRQVGIPAAGSTVNVGAVGLTLNTELIAWSDITIDAVGFRIMPDTEGPTTMIVERLVLSSPQTSFALDTRLMENGTNVVNKIYRLRNLGLN